MADRRTSDTGPFALVPEWLLDTEISDRSVRLYAVLARFADKETGTSWPSRRTLAERLRTSLKSIDRALAELVAVGALTVHARHDPDAGQRSNLYTIRRVTPGGRTADDPPLSTGDQPPLVTGDAQNESHRERESIEREEETRAIDADFELWWSVYPRKIDKRAALMKYRARRRAGVTETDLVAAAMNYAAAVLSNGTAEKYVKHAATFLNGSYEEWIGVEPPEPQSSGSKWDRIAEHDLQQRGQRRQ